MCRYIGLPQRSWYKLTNGPCRLRIYNTAKEMEYCERRRVGINERGKRGASQGDVKVELEGGEKNAFSEARARGNLRAFPLRFTRHVLLRSRFSFVNCSLTLYVLCNEIDGETSAKRTRFNYRRAKNRRVKNTQIPREHKGLTKILPRREFLTCSS